VLELIGVSNKSFHDAVERVLHEASGVDEKHFKASKEVEVLSRLGLINADSRNLP
jgi:hypothetical protein